MFTKKETDSIPEYISHYKIVCRLGRGGMGDIYKAIQDPLNRIVALKVLPPHFGRDEEFAKRFRIEADAIARLQHQNIVSLYEYGEENGYRYFAMQFVDGRDLSRHINEGKEMPVEEIIDFSKQICRGLRYAHAQSVVHRDIKPQNILIDKNGIVKLSDFGIAKIFSGSDITMTGFTLGTPEYMSPEQALGKNIDHQTDLYSLGIVMYEMLTKKPPFTANDPMAIAYKQVHELPVPPSAKRKETPKRLELIILKALKKNKEERYRSVEEMLDHLDSVDLRELAGSPTATMRAVGGGPAGEGAEAGENTAAERRIVDRRNSTGTGPAFGDRRYWREMARTQWVSWLLLAGLGALFVLHLLRGHGQG
jgi:eukaryotic-like serine/threonine-protein kinase